jgi:hypothetical protein
MHCIRLVEKTIVDGGSLHGRSGILVDIADQHLPRHGTVRRGRGLLCERKAGLAIADRPLSGG